MPRTDNNTTQAKRRLSDLDIDYAADQSSTASEISGVTLTPTLTPTAVETKVKNINFGDVAMTLRMPLKSGNGEVFEAVHREKRPRFMSV